MGQVTRLPGDCSRRRLPPIKPRAAESGVLGAPGLGVRRRTLLLALCLMLVPVLAAARGLYAMFAGGPYPPGWGGDAYGHLFKVWKLWRSGWPPWIEEWYNGYPFLRFYPPLSYLVACILSYASGSPLLGYKLLVAVSLPIASATMYLLARRLGYSVPASLLSAVAYSTSPWLYRIVAPEACLPRVLGYALAPLLPLALIVAARGCGGLRGLLLASLAVSAVLLSHHSLFLVCLTVSALLLLSVLDRETLLRLPKRLALVALASLGLACFWLIPFLAEAGLASFTPESQGYLFKLQSAKPELLARIAPGGWGYYQGLLRLAVGLAAPLAALALGVMRRLALPLALASTLTLLLSLGYYGPTPWLNQLPVLVMVPAYRWLDGFQLASALSAGLALELVSRFPRLARASTLILLAFLATLVLESQGQLPYWHGEEFDRCLVAALELVAGDESTGWRFYQWGLGITKGSMIAFSPVVAGRPSVDGWYRQGDPLYTVHSLLGWSLANDQHLAAKLLERLAVKYVIVDTKLKDSTKAVSTLERLGFRLVMTCGSIRVYRWENASLVRVAAPGVLAVTCSPSVVRDVFPGVTVGSCFADDYQLEDLLHYRAVILYDYRYSSLHDMVWSTLLEYVRRGGTLIVDLYHTPDMLRGIPELGIEAAIVRVHGSITLTTREGENVTLHMEYNGGDWVALVYRVSQTLGGFTQLVGYKGYTVIGRLRIGKGSLILVGLNLVLHAHMNHGAWELNILRSLVPVWKQEARVELVGWSDGRIVFHYTSPTPVLARVAETWYPHWRTYVDGKPWGHPQKDDTGLMLLSLPVGEHTVELRFEDPYQPLRIASLLVLALVLAVLALPQARRLLARSHTAPAT